MRNLYNLKISLSGNILPPKIYQFIAAACCMFFLMCLSASDVSAQVASCRDITRQVDATGPITITPSDIDDGGSGFGTFYINAIGTPSVDLTCSDHPSVTLTLIVDDGVNTPAQCTSVVTLEDNDNPTAMCISSIIAEVGDVLIPSDIDNGSSDACSPGSESFEIEGSAMYTVTCTDASSGSISVVLEVFDIDNNSSTCSTTVIVTDQVTPSPNCSDFTLNLSTGSAPFIAASLIASSVGSFTDNCSANVTESLSQNSFGCIDLGDNVVDYIVTDSHNSASCTATVTVVDDVAPTIICQTGQFTLNLDGNGDATISTTDIIASSGDNCSAVTESLDIMAFDCDHIGTNIVTATATEDVGGLSSSCTRTVVVVDVDVPVASCSPTDITVELDASGEASITAADVNSGSSDNCSVVLTANPKDFTCANVGIPVTVTLTVDDGSNAVSTCTANVVVEDIKVPDAICATAAIPVTLSGPDNTAVVSVADVDNDSGDNCGVAKLNLDFMIPYISELHYDNAGTDAGEFIEVSGLADIDLSGYALALYSETGYMYDEIFLIGTLSGGDCGSIAFPYTGLQNGPNDGIALVAPSGAVLEFISYEGTLTANSGPANGMTSTDIGVSEDAVTPIGSSLSLEDGGWAVTPSNSEGAVNSGLTCVLPFDCNTLGAQMVTLTVTDANGNTDDCTATVTVLEQTGAILAKCQDITLDLNTGTTISPADIDDGSVGDCSLVLNNVTPNSFDCSNLGANTVTLVVTDGGGANTSSCNAVVTVTNPATPQATCLTDLTVQLDATGNATITTEDIDNGSFLAWNGDLTMPAACGSVDLSLTIGSYDCTDVGKTTVMETLTATDPVTTMTATCMTLITVKDMNSPTALCKDVTVSVLNGQACVTAAMVDNGSTDECNALIMGLDKTNFNCGDMPSYTVKMTVIDGSGNEDDCTSVITLEDNTPPTANCLPDITVYVDEDDGTPNDGSRVLSAAELNNGSHDMQVAGFYDVQDNLTGSCNEPLVSISGTGTAISSSDWVNGRCDDGYFGITTANSYSLYGTAYNKFSIGTNGGIGVGSTNIDHSISSGSFGVTSYTSPVAPALVVYNSDLYACSTNTTVYWQESGNWLIIEYSNIGGCCSSVSNSTDGITFQVKWNSVTDEIIYLYSDTEMESNPFYSNFNRANIGLDNADGINFEGYKSDRTNGSTITGLTCVSFTPIPIGTLVDNCTAPADLMFSIPATTYTCSDLGTYTVELEVSDNSGNTSTCTTNVTVEDNSAPDITCKTGPIDIYLDASGSMSPTENDLLTSWTDPCGIPAGNFSFSPISVGCLDINETTTNDVQVTITATDANGNSDTGSSCSVYVNVIDNIAPTLTCQDITRSEDYTVQASEFAAVFSDACGTDQVAFDNAFTDFSEYYDCNSVGTYTLTIYANDIYGAVSSCTAQLTIVSSGNLQVNCTQNSSPPNLFIDSNSGLANIPPPLNNWASWSDQNCAGSTLSTSLSQTTFDCDDEYFSNGNTFATVTITVTDNAGNSATDHCNFRVNDASMPSSSNCPTSIPIVDVSLDPVTMTVQLDADAIATEIGFTMDANVCDEHHFGWAGADASENQDQCDISTIGYFPLSNGSLLGSSAASIHYQTMNCSDDGVIYGANLVPVSNYLGPAKGNVIFPSGNLACNYYENLCAVYIRVTSEVPVAECKNYTAYLENNGTVTVPAAMIDNGSTDDCGNQFFSLSKNSFDCSEIGMNLVTLTVSDGTGASSCTAYVTVEDNVDPSAICQNVTVVLDSDGEGNVTAADFDNLSTDNCVGLTFNAVDSSDPTIDYNDTDFTCANHGFSTSVIFEVTDDSGNTDSATCSLTVQDQSPPTIVCKTNYSVQLEAVNGLYTLSASELDGGSEDNCGIMSFANSATTFSCNDLGINQVFVTVTDNSGITSSGSCSVEVLGTDPIANCHPNITVDMDPTGNGSIAEDEVNDTSTDHCDVISGGLTYDTDITDFGCLDGVTTVTMTVTDADGNSAQCMSDVTVRDLIAPTPICATGVSVQLDAVTGTYSGLTAMMLDGGSSDNCSSTPSISPVTFDCSHIGSQSVHLTVTDPSNNTQTTVVPCIVNVLNPAPVANCQDKTVYLNSSGPVTIIAAQVDNSTTPSYDICGQSITLALSKSSFNCADALNGPVAVTLTAVDPSGNSDQCTANVTVETDITAVCQDITVFLGTNDDVTVSAVDIDNGSATSCGVLSLGISSPATFSCAQVGQTIPMTLFASDGISGDDCVAMVTIESDPDLPCQCIPDYRIATDNPIPDPVPDGYYPAIIDIECDAVVPVNRLVEFKAGSSILLLPGFEVNNNTVFLAHIGPCP